MRASRPITTAQTSAVITRLREQRIPQITADLARRKLAEIEPRQGKPYRTIVDGRENAPLDSVRFGGNIRFLFLDLGPVLDWIWAELVAHSPVGPERGQPHYFQVHWLIVDGNRVQLPILGEPFQIPVKAVCRFVNPRPYAAKIERGLSVQAPDGVYELTALAAQSRFPFVSIEFDYTDLPGLPYSYPQITVLATTR
jgi:hypothetical protein